MTPPGLQSAKDLRSFSALVRRRRLALHATQKALADAVGVNDRQISNIEKGLNWPSMSVGIKLCRVLAIDLPRGLGRSKN